MSSQRSILIVRLIVVVAALAVVWAVRPNHIARAAFTCSSAQSGPWASSSTWNSCGGGFPGSTDDVVINPGHIIDTTATTYQVHNVQSWGEIKLGGSFVVNGNYSAYNGTASVTGVGTFNVVGGTGTEMCGGNMVATFGSGIGIYFSPNPGVTAYCTNGVYGALGVGNGTLVLGTSSTPVNAHVYNGATLTLNPGVTLAPSGALQIDSGGLLDMGASGQATGTPLINNGTVRATRNSPGTGSTYFGLAGGPNNGFVVQPSSGGFSQLILDWHGSDHPYKTGSSVTSGVGWGEYWVLSVTGSDNARVTIPTRLFTPDSNSKVCYHVSGATWNCAATGYDAVSTPNTVTRNPVTINTNLAFAAGGNVSATGSVLTPNGSGNALNFDGVDDYILTGLNPSATLGQSFTIETWVNPHSAGDYRGIGGENTNPTGVIFGQYETATGGWVFAALGSGGLLPPAVVTSIPLNQWTHVTAVYVGGVSGSITVYLNGVQAAQSTWSNRTISQPATFTIGRAHVNSDRYFDGQIDEFRVWSTARTVDQIRQNMYREISSGSVAAYHFNEASGATASDSSGNGRTGTLYNFPASPWRTSGAFAGPRQALNFDGVDDYVNAGASSPAFSNNLTVEAWVRTTDSRTGRDLVAWGSTDTCIGDNAQFRLDNGVLNFGMHDIRGASCGNYDNAWQSVVAATPLINTGNWTHVALVKSGSSITLYANGQSVATGTINKTLSVDRMAIGSLFYAGSAVDDYLAGDLDEVRIWNVARSAADIRQNMAHTLIGSETGLVAYYRFDQHNAADQTVLYDLTSNSAHGTLIFMDATTDWISSTAFNTWIGSDSTDWSAAANWSRNAAPVAGDNLGAQIFPGSNMPTLSSPTNFTNLVIADGTTLNVATDMTLTGNWLNQGTFNHTAGTVTFSGNGSAQQLIGSTTFNNLTINSGAIFDLGTSAIAAVNGTLTNNGTIRATRNIDATGAQTFGLAGGPVNGANVSLNVTSDSFTSITLDRHDTQHAHFTGVTEASGVGYARYWTITPVGTGTINITLPANFTTGADSKVCRYTGGAGSGWDCAADAYTANTVTRNGVTTFSDWATGNVNPTAITLNTLDAKAAPDTSAMGWLLALLGAFTLGGLWLMRKAAHD